MSASQAFKAAFWAGMASPCLLYSSPAPYSAFVQVSSLPQLFSIVGGYMSQAFSHTEKQISEVNTHKVGFQESLNFD